MFEPGALWVCVRQPFEMTGREVERRSELAITGKGVVVEELDTTVRQAFEVDLESIPVPHERIHRRSATEVLAQDLNRIRHLSFGAHSREPVDAHRFDVRRKNRRIVEPEYASEIIVDGAVHRMVVGVDKAWRNTVEVQDGNRALDVLLTVRGRGGIGEEPRIDFHQHGPPGADLGANLVDDGRPRVELDDFDPVQPFEIMVSELVERPLVSFEIRAQREPESREGVMSEDMQQLDPYVYIAVCFRPFRLIGVEPVLRVGVGIECAQTAHQPSSSCFA